MTRAKKILSGLFIALFAMLVIAVLVANRLLDSYSRTAVAALSQRAKRHGVVVADPHFGRARIAGIKTARWTDLTAQLRFPESDAFAPNKVFDVHVGQADLWLVGGGQAVLEAQDVSIDSSDQSFPASGAPANATDKEAIRVQRFQCQFQLDLFHPMPSLEEVMPQLVALLRAGTTQLPIEAEGMLEFSFNGAPAKARLGVAELDSGQALVLNPADLRPLSEHFEEALTEAELELIATYPLRVRKLLLIKQDAEKSAADAAQADAAVPQDAYRHILWSFLLTREYGARFAERVTNSHEAGDTGNTASERRMDLHNNAIGRTLAEQDVRRSDILARVLNDPAVIREPK